MEMIFVNKKKIMDEIVKVSKKIEDKKLQLSQLKGSLDDCMKLNPFVWSVIWDKIYDLEREIPKEINHLASLYIKLGQLNNNRNKRRMDLFKGMGVEIV